MKGAINPGGVKDASASLLRAFSGAPRCAAVGATDIVYNFNVTYLDEQFAPGLFDIKAPPGTSINDPPKGLPFGNWLLRITSVVNLTVPVSFRLGMAQNTDSGAKFLVNGGSLDRVFLGRGPTTQQAQINSNWAVGDGLQLLESKGPDLFTLRSIDWTATGTKLSQHILPEQNESCLYQFYPFLFTSLIAQSESDGITTGPNHWNTSADGFLGLRGWLLTGVQRGLYPTRTILGTLQFRFIRLSSHPLFIWNVTPPRTINFTNKSFFNPALNPTWDWDFGDGSGHVSTLNASHSYPSSGRYVASLTVTTADGTSKVFDQIIDLPLKANFTISGLTGAVGIDLSIGAVTWDWDWGDGSAHSTTENPSHSYARGQHVIITLTVGDGAGKTDSISKPFSTPG